LGLRRARVDSSPKGAEPRVAAAAGKAPFMKIQPPTGTPVRRDLTDPRSTGAPVSPTRKTLLNDRRSTR